MFTNDCLPKYFFGDKMNQNDQSDKNILNYSEDVHLSEPNLSSIPSPSSSLASTKKLEWDSGADIGYIYDSRKSKSFPSLNMDPQTETSKPKNIRALACIGEGDALKSPKSKNKKAKSFKHSTPYYYRQIKTCASAGDSSNEKATSPINIYEIKDECLQTTLIHRSSKEVQTDDLENVDRKQIKDKSLQTDIRDILGPQSMSSSSSSSSKSGSFKYIPGSEFANNSQSLSNGTIKSGVTIKSSSFSTSSRRDETDSGSCSPLGQMISTQYSKDLIADIDKSLEILQKFIKSKNYSNDTKKHYAKKIVTKIITNRYSDDTESSSDIKTPPTNNEDQIEDGIKTDDQANSSIEKKYVECGIQCDEINKKSQIISERNECKIKESLEKLSALQTDLKNWRDAQTLSEKLFEARKSHKTRSKKSNEQFTSSSSSSNRVVEEEKRDYLIQHSKNERKRQLSWINNEISYLQKLKEMLQLREQSKSNTASTSSSSNRKADSRRHNLDDVERQFNQEFGLAPKDKVAADKLSTYLTNEQIKFILEHDVHGRPQPEERKAALNSSYNSHKNSIYGGDVLKKTQHTSSSDLNQKTTVAVDTATQYSNRVNVEPANMAAQVQPPFCEIIPTDKVEQSCSSSEYDESIIIDKENIVERCPHKTTTKFNKGGTAYFLTFEEESMSEFDTEERKILEQVVVKIPKYHRSTRKTNKHNNNKSETCTRTLEEYLLKNRPNFVRTANWRWTQVRSLDSQEKKNVFTCHEMKEMTQRKYKNLPEIQEKIKNNKTQNERKHNRFMANIFSKKLQKKTLQGHICLATCKNVMASE